MVTEDLNTHREASFKNFRIGTHSREPFRLPLTRVNEYPDFARIS
jgi:hypothetical protein